MKQQKDFEGISPELQDNIEALDKKINDISNNSFIMGAKAISKIALERYIPDIKKAKNNKERNQAIQKLCCFLGCGEKLS